MRNRIASAEPGASSTGANGLALPTTPRTPASPWGRALRNRFASTSPGAPSPGAIEVALPTTPRSAAAPWNRLASAALGALLCAAATAQTNPPFVFDKVALKLHAECEALDRQFERRALVYHDPVLESRVSSLAAPFLPATALERVQWKVRVIRHPAVNAFALPNGSIYLATGLIARAENDEQLAGRLAHEIAHVAGRDAYRFQRALRKKSMETFVAGAGSIFLGGIAAYYLADLIAGHPDQIGILAAVAGYPQDIEEEADRTALGLLKAAGRDPVPFARLLLLINEKLEPEPRPFWKNQPPIERRLSALKASAGIDADPQPGPDGGYVGGKRPLLLENIQLDLGARRFRSAVAAASRLVNAAPSDAVALFWLGESYRLLGPRPGRLVGPDVYRTAARETEQQEADRLLHTNEGRAALEAHYRTAEELFRKAAAIDPAYPDPHFGHAELCEAQGRKDDAVAAYRRYIDLTREPAARERANRRINAIPGGAEAAK